MAAVAAYLSVARGPFLLLPVALVAAGTAAAAYEGAFRPGRAFWALVGLVALHVAVNVINEVSDFRTGIDQRTKRTPFSGGSGTLPAGRLTPGQAWAFGLASGAVGLAVGVFFLYRVGRPFLPLLVVGAVCVTTYTNLLARVGLGEIAAGLGLGALPVAGTVLVQAGAWTTTAWAAAFPAFLMTFDLLLLNEFPDQEADRTGGRRNLVLLLGRKTAARVYVGAALLVPIGLAAAVAAGPLPAAALAALAPSLLLVSPVRWALRDPLGDVPAPALGANVAWNLLTNVVLAGTLVLAAS